MEQRMNKTLSKERCKYVWVFALAMLYLHLVHFANGVKNVNHQNIIDIPSGKNQDLIKPHTLKISNEAITPSITVKSDNEGNLSPSFNNKSTSTQIFRRDLIGTGDENANTAENTLRYHKILALF